MAPADERPTILLVDDDPRFLADLRELLGITMKDVRIVTADSAPAALLILQDEPVAVVVADQHMPGGSGLDLLENIQRRWPAVARIMLTGDPRQDLARRAVNEARVEDFLTKPPDPRELVNLLRRSLVSFDLNAQILKASR
jgi:response regulator RpfG family c-di-GMP phosphodiesterase